MAREVQGHVAHLRLVASGVSAPELFSVTGRCLTATGLDTSTKGEGNATPA